MLKDEFEEIYRLYAADIYHFLLRLSRNEAVAMDILQDTMLKAITSIEQFKWNCSMKTYLCTIAKNEYYNYVKRADNRNLPLDAAQHAAEESLEHRISDKLQAMQLKKLAGQIANGEIDACMEQLSYAEFMHLNGFGMDVTAVEQIRQQLPSRSIRTAARTHLRRICCISSGNNGMKGITEFGGEFPEISPLPLWERGQELEKAPFL